MTRASAPPFILLLLGLCLLAMLLTAFQSFLPATLQGSGAQQAALLPVGAQDKTAGTGEAGADASLAMTGQQADDLSELMRKIQADPKDAEALTQIGEAFLLSKDWTRAEVFFARAIAASPEDARPRYLLGINLYQQARMSEAAKVFEELLQIKQDAATQYNLAVIYKYHLGKAGEASALLRSIMDSGNADASTVALAKKELER